MKVPSLLQNANTEYERPVAPDSVESNEYDELDFSDQTLAFLSSSKV